MSVPNAAMEGHLIVRQPCVRCGHILHTGEGKVTLSMTVAELEDLITQTTNLDLRKRLLCAIGLLDAQKERVLA
jgi:hypothetical protein